MLKMIAFQKLVCQDEDCKTVFYIKKSIWEDALKDYEAGYRLTCPKCQSDITIKSKCENCGEIRHNVKYSVQYGQGEYLCNECRGEY